MHQSPVLVHWSPKTSLTKLSFRNKTRERNDLWRVLILRLAEQLANHRRVWHGFVWAEVTSFVNSSAAGRAGWGERDDASRSVPGWHLPGEVLHAEQQDVEREATRRQDDGRSERVRCRGHDRRPATDEDDAEPKARRFVQEDWCFCGVFVGGWHVTHCE